MEDEMIDMKKPTNKDIFGPEPDDARDIRYIVIKRRLKAIESRLDALENLH